jgi:hypothetical protein
MIYFLKGKGKGKVHPRTGHEGPKGLEVQPYFFLKLSARQGWVDGSFLYIQLFLLNTEKELIHLLYEFIFYI